MCFQGVGMAAYAILDLNIYDIAAYLKYQRAVKPLLESAGARYMEEFYESEAYQALEPQRRACSSARILGVEGCSRTFRQDTNSAPACRQSRDESLQSP